MRPSWILACSTLAALAFGCSAPADGTPAGNGGNDELNASPLTSAKFVCSTSNDVGDGDFGEGKVHTLTFSLAGLDGDTKSLAWVGDSLAAEKDDDEKTRPIKASPEGSPLELINDNYNVTFEDGDLRLFGDSDGLQFTTAVLFKKSGFKTGTIKVEGAGGDADSKLDCVVTRLSSDAPTAASGTCAHGFAGYECK
jgi:hypothetical protein